MDSVSRESIANALQAYQDTVLAQNLAMLKILVNAAEHGLDHTTEYTDEESLELQLRLFDSQYGLIGPDTGVTALQDVLNGDLLQDIIEKCCLDGIDHEPIETSLRGQWFEEMHEMINERGILTPRAAGPDSTAEQDCDLRDVQLPAELHYLGTLVRGIYGPGLPYYRLHAQYSLLTDPKEALRQERSQQVVVPKYNRPTSFTESAALDYCWEDWELAVGVHIGDGPLGWSGTWLVYCRRPKQDGDWKWRYGLSIEYQFQSELFDSLESFLAWYSQFQQQTEEDLEIIPVEQVM